MNELLPVIVGGIIGVAGGVVGPVLLDMQQRRRERRNVTRAILAEIRSILEIVRVRGYVEAIRELLTEGRKIPDDDVVLYYGFSVSFNPFAVYEANLDKIGLLQGDLASLIPQFYMQSQSILEDIRTMNQQKSPAFNLNESLAHLKSLLELFESTAALGRRILESAA